MNLVRKGLIFLIGEVPDPQTMTPMTNAIKTTHGVPSYIFIVDERKTFLLPTLCRPITEVTYR